MLKQQQTQLETAEDLLSLLRTPGVSSRCFRLLLHHGQNARDFCLHHFPKETIRTMELSRLEVLPERFVDPHVQDVLGDVVLRMPSRPKTGWTYVIILQCCRPHPLIPVHMKRCEKRVYEMHVNTFQGNRPVDIYPTLYYTGAGPYPGPTDLEDVLAHLPQENAGEA